MDMFRHEVSAVVERWVHESDLDFFEMMMVLEEVKMDLMLQNIEPDEDLQGNPQFSYSQAGLSPVNRPRLGS